jgi:hypothetical protein
MLAAALLIPALNGAFAGEDGADFAGTAAARAAVRALTMRVLQLHEEVGKQPAQARQRALDRLTAAIKTRRQALLSLLESDPAAVLEAALPAAVRRSFPAGLQMHLEDAVTLEGTLEVVIADNFETLVSRMSYLLTIDRGERVALHFAGAGPDLLSGSRVRVRGIRLDGQMALAAAESGSVETLAAAAAAPLTVKRVAVILFNLQTNPVQPYTAAFAKGVTFTNAGGVNAYFQEASFGAVGLTGKINADGDVFGWYTIACDSDPATSTPSCTSCDYWNWAAFARSAAAVDGFAAANYNYVIYAFPQHGACPWWGLAGGGAWINGSYQLRVVGHELGHLFGLSHAASYSCTDANGQAVAISQTCTINEYGDPFDIMGSAAYHVNGFHKGLLGWLAPSNTQDVTTDGVYTLAPLEYASSGVQVLRLPRDLDASGNATKYYYIEFRQPFGFDNFGASAPVVNGVSIRLAPPYVVPAYTSLRPLLIDTTPASGGGFADAPLLAGRTFEDAITGIAVTTASVSASGAAVEVKFGPLVCAPGNPSLSLAPSSQWAYAGQPLVYTLTLTNNNSSVCPAATFDVAASLPSGWSLIPTPLSLTLASGASATQQITVNSTPDAAPGFYTVTETVSATADPGSAVSASAGYNILVPDTTPPTIAITSPLDGSTLPKKGTVKIAAKAADASGIGGIELLVDGRSVKTCWNVTSCAAKWSMNGVGSGWHTVTASATDEGGPPPNTATVSIAVLKP